MELHAFPCEHAPVKKVKTMRFSEQELSILAACETEADLSMKEVATRARVREHVARRALMKFQDEGIIQKRAYVNSFLLGTAPFLFVFSFNTSARRNRERFFQFLRSMPEVSFLSEVGGSFNLFVEARFSSIYQIQAFLDRLSNAIGNVFEEKQVLALTSMCDFPTLAPASSRTKLREFYTSVSNQSIKLDATDLNVLNGIAANWGEPNTKLAKKLALPASTLEYHIKQLTKAGVLIGTRYLVNLVALGFSVVYQLISVKSCDPEIRESMLKFARAHNAVHCFRTFLGAWDIMLECHFRSNEENLRFVEKLLEENAQHIDKVESLTVLYHEKISDCTVQSSSKL